MDQIYNTPESALTNQTASSASSYKLYKVSAVGVATFFGTLLAGGYVMAQNYKAMGEFKKANQALWLSVLATIAVFAIGYFLPESIPGVAITVPQIIAMVQIAKKEQGSFIDQHAANGGRLESNWKAFGISLLFIVVILVLVVGTLLFFDPTLLNE